MLNKEVCKECIHRMAGKRIVMACWKDWNNHDDELWEAGYVYCRHGIGGTNTTGSIPKYCSYSAEHAVSS
jgi:hypothetical protein